jgi:hypothetical protein
LCLAADAADAQADIDGWALIGGEEMGIENDLPIGD